MQQALDDLIQRRTRKAIGQILGTKEREVDPLLKGVAGGREASLRLRSAVLDTLNEFRDLMVDVLESVCCEYDGVLLNEEYLKRLEKLVHGIYEEVVPAENRRPARAG